MIEITTDLKETAVKRGDGFAMQVTVGAPVDYLDLYIKESFDAADGTPIAATMTAPATGAGTFSVPETATDLAPGVYAMVIRYRRTGDTRKSHNATLRVVAS